MNVIIEAKKRENKLLHKKKTKINLNNGYTSILELCTISRMTRRRKIHWHNNCSNDYQIPKFKNHTQRHKITEIYLVLFLNSGASHHFALLIFLSDFSHVIGDVIMYWVSHPQHIIFRGNPSSTAFAILHAPPKCSSTTHTVSHKYIWFIDQL